MKVLYDECIESLRDNKCSECNDFYQCSVCDYFQQRYQQGRADAIEEFMDKLPYSALVRFSTIRKIAEQLKESKNE